MYSLFSYAIIIRYIFLGDWVAFGRNNNKRRKKWSKKSKKKSLQSELEKRSMILKPFNAKHNNVA